jgi:hypothetical protein
MQLMHADAVFRGRMLQWGSFMDPDPEAWERFERAAAEQRPEADDWTNLEPDFTP